MKILYLVNIPSPYRVEFFDLLGKACTLTVCYEEKISDQKDRDPKWFKKNNQGNTYKEVYLNTRNVVSKKVCFDVADYVLNKQYDLVVIADYASPTGIYSIIRMKMKRIKFAIEADGAQVKSGKGLKEGLKKWLISSAHWWLSSGKVCDDYFLFYGASRNRIYRYPFTSLSDQEIETKRVQVNKAGVRSKLGIKEEKIILSVGQFIHRKGFDVLIKACKGLGSDTGVYIVGGKATREYLDLIQKYELKQVYFLEFMSKEELSEFYASADIFVLPTREDIWGLVINEAMAHGLPIVTTDRCVAGLELVENGINGYIVNVDDPISMHDRMNELLQNDQLRVQMKKNNINKIKGYTIEKMTDVHMEIFHRIT